MDPKLRKAAAEGNINTLQSSGEPLDEIITPAGNTILHIYLASITIFEEKPANFINQVLRHWPSLLRKANNVGDTPLHVAARFGHSEVVRVLIARAKEPHQRDPERGVREVHAMMGTQNLRKDTALHEAARYNRLGVVEILVKEGPGLEYEVNDLNESPLYLAAERGNHLVVKEMVRTCTSIAYDGPQGKTALHAAVISSTRCPHKTNMIQDILKERTHLSTKKDNDSWTSLHYAGFLGNSLAARMILEADESAAYVTNNERQMTALHVAGKCNMPNTINEIISQCPDCCELVDAKGWSFVHYAAITQSFKVIKMVVNTPSLRYLLNQSDLSGQTPFHLLAASQNRPLEKLKDLHILANMNKVIIRDKLEEEKASAWIESLGNSPTGLIIWDIYHSQEELKQAFIQSMEKSRNVHLVVATLIATVSFTAAFTLPGGLISDSNDPKQGSPVLIQNLYFKGFIMWDVYAMMFSVFCILTNLALHILGFQWKTVPLAFAQLLSLVLAVMAMMTSFYAGMFAVLWPSPSLTHRVTISVSLCIIYLMFIVPALCVVTFILSPYYTRKLVELWKMILKRALRRV